MIYSLKNPSSQFPPGGWSFSDPRTGFQCKPMEGNVAMQSQKIIQNRRANPHLYHPGEGHWFDPAYVIQEIYAQKAKTHPELFKGHDDLKAGTMNPIDKNVSICSCGGILKNEYCQSCGGARILGRKCEKCGKQYK
jgi:hypothetical protein